MFRDSVKDKNGVTINGLLILVPKDFSDSRGFFLENWNERTFNLCVNEKVNFVQDNHSLSSCGVLRGLHYQIPPKAQGKLVTCISGEIFDVVVDIRARSLTYGHWAGIILNDKNHRQLWIPKGFAHGFITLSHQANVLYKTTDFWDKDCERTLRWDDSQLNIDWPLHLLNGIQPHLSEKDQNALGFNPLLNDAPVE